VEGKKEKGREREDGELLIKGEHFVFSDEKSRRERETDRQIKRKI
jgi:hypothetical protein